MRAMRVHELSENVDVLRMDEVKLPAPGPGEVRLRLKACSVNFPDILMVQGKYQFKPDLPFSPGMEGAGIVAEVGYGVTRLKAGDRVVAGLRVGGFAEEVNVPELACRPIPGSMDFAAAAAYPAAYLTAYVALVCRGHLQKGETLLVHGGSSGIGTTAIQLASSFGAYVIVTAGSAEKCEACLKLGADRAINYRSEDFVGEVKEATSGKGADVILDMVGGDYVARNYQAAAVEGRIVQIGVQAGAVASTDFSRLMIKRLTHTGSTLRPRTVDFKGAIAAALEAKVWPLMATRAVAPVMDMIFPLKEAWRAHERMEEGAHIGKIVLDVS